jgi:bacteriocin biosynthesis cyclodehydratase domain-containing protein
VEIPHEPLLKPWYRTASLNGAVLLQHGESVVRLEGRAAEQLLPALMPLLDGTRTVDAIVALLGEPIRPAVEGALALLARHGLLLDGAQARKRDTRARTAEFFAALDGTRSSLATGVDVLARARVTVAGSATIAPPLVDILRASGVGLVEHVPALDGGAAFDGSAALNGGAALDGGACDPAGTLALVVPSGEELIDVPTWNRNALHDGTAWLPVLPFDGQVAAVGPLFVPGETACYECFRLRRAANLDYRPEFWALEEIPAYRPSAPAADALLAGIAATFALRWILHRDPGLPGVVHTVEHRRGLELRAHVVYRVPRCSACSGLHDRSAPLPWFAGVEFAGGHVEH